MNPYMMSETSSARVLLLTAKCEVSNQLPKEPVVQQEEYKLPVLSVMGMFLHEVFLSRFILNAKISI